MPVAKTIFMSCMKPSTGEAGDQFKFIAILRANLPQRGRNQRSNGCARGMQAMPGGDGGGGLRLEQTANEPDRPVLLAILNDN